MKKLAIVLSLAAAIVMVSGCASKPVVDQPVAAQDTPAAHHDYKGEVGK